MRLRGKGGRREQLDAGGARSAHRGQDTRSAPVPSSLGANSTTAHGSGSKTCWVTQELTLSYFWPHSSATPRGHTHTCSTFSDFPHAVLLGSARLSRRAPHSRGDCLERRVGSSSTTGATSRQESLATTPHTTTVKSVADLAIVTNPSASG